MAETAMMANVGLGAENKSIGAYNALRQNQAGQLAVASPLYDAVMRGRCFAVANQAGVTSQAGLSATTPVLTLYNPAGSGFNLALLYASAVCIVSAATAGAVFVAVGTNTTAAAVTGTLTTAHRNLKLGSSSNMAAIPMLAATLPAAPVAVSILGALLTGAITTIPYQNGIDRWFNGAIVLTPGTNLSIQTGVASGASGLLCEYIWEEFPV